MLARIQIRRDSKTNWDANNPILHSGEIGYETLTERFKIGDGISNWSALPYQLGHWDGQTNGDISFGYQSGEGNVKIRNNLQIDGNLFVNGTTTTVNTKEVTFNDRMLTLNWNEDPIRHYDSSLISGLDINIGWPDTAFAPAYSGVDFLSVSSYDSTNNQTVITLNNTLAGWPATYKQNYVIYFSPSEPFGDPDLAFYIKSYDSTTDELTVVGDASAVPNTKDFEIHNVIRQLYWKNDANTADAAWYVDGNKIWHEGNLNIAQYLPLSGGTLTGNLEISKVGTSTIKLTNTDVELIEGQITGELNFYQSDSTSAGTGYTARIATRSSRRPDDLNSHYGNAADLGFWVGSVTASNNADLEAMTIRAGGKVGIGTTSPVGSLEVMTDGDTSSDGIILRSSSTGGRTLRLWATGDKAHIGAGGGTEDLILNHAGGNVGIGTTSPSSRLHIVGELNAGNDSNRVRINSTSSHGIIEFNSDTSGLVRSNTGDLRLQTDGANDRLTIDSSGNVGIGTSNPQHNLSVYDGNEGIDFDINYGGGAWNRILSYDRTTSGVEYPIKIQGLKFTVDTNGTERFRVNDNGNVGIGDTTPSEKLEVNGAIKLGNTSSTNAGTIRWSGTDFEGYTGSAWESLTTPPSSGTWSASSNDIYYNSGKVGIGTTSPSSPLHVVGSATGSDLVALNLTNKNTADGTGTAIRFTNSTTEDFLGGEIAVERQSDGSNDLRINLKNANSTSTYPRMLTIDGSTGRVGIGETAPSSKLDIGLTSSFNKISGKYIDYRGVGNGTNDGYLLLVPSSTTSAGKFVGTIVADRGNINNGNENMKAHFNVSVAYNVNRGMLELFGNADHYFKKLTIVTFSGVDYIAAYFNQTGGGPANGIFVEDAIVAGLDANCLTMKYSSEIAVVDSNFGSIVSNISGNVGIGITSPQTKLHLNHGETSVNGPQELLRLQGDWNGATGVDGDGALIRFTNQHNSATNPNTGEYNVAGIAGLDDSSNWGGSLHFQTSPTGGNGGNNLQTRMVVRYDGKVGIGTTSPASELDVTGVIRAGSNNSTGGGTALRVRYQSAGDHTANFGAAQSSGAPLIGYAVESSQSASDTFVSTADNANFYRAALVVGADLEFWNGPAQGTTVGSNATMERRFIVGSNGRVGIGTSSPSKKLHVTDSNEIVATLTNSTNASATKTLLRFSQSSDSDLIAGTVGINRLGANAGCGFEINLADSSGNEQNRLTILEGGNAGIGASNPSEKLHVAGAIRLGTTSSTNTGTIRWSGSDFEGYDGSTWNSLTLGGSATQWTLTANGTSNYIFSGPGIHTANNDPDIFLVRGQTYRFDNQSGGHPFEIRYSPGGTAYSDGVSQSGTITTFTVPMNAPSLLYYQCTSHSSMLGNIYISSNELQQGWKTLGSTNYDASVSPQYDYKFYRVTDDITYDFNRVYEVIVDADDNSGMVAIYHLYLSSHGSSGNHDRIMMSHVSGRPYMMRVVLDSNEHVWIAATNKWGAIRIRGLHENEDVSSMPFADSQLSSISSPQFNETAQFIWNGDTNEITLLPTATLEGKLGIGTNDPKLKAQISGAAGALFIDGGGYNPDSTPPSGYYTSLSNDTNHSPGIVIGNEWAWDAGNSNYTGGSNWIKGHLHNYNGSGMRLSFNDGSMIYDHTANSWGSSRYDEPTHSAPSIEINRAVGDTESVFKVNIRRDSSNYAQSGTVFGDLLDVKHNGYTKILGSLNVGQSYGNTLNLGVPGDIRYNSTTDDFEGNTTSSGWVSLTQKRVNLFLDTSIARTLAGNNTTWTWGPTGSSATHIVAGFTNFKNSAYASYDRLCFFGGSGYSEVVISDLLAINPTASSRLYLGIDDQEQFDDVQYLYFDGNDLWLVNAIGNYGGYSNAIFKYYRIDVVA